MTFNTSITATSPAIPGRVLTYLWDDHLTREDAEKVLEACPDTQWQFLFALSRYAGLRCPSEHLAMKWTDVDWEGNRFLVHSVKTERHAGKESRWVPIFPELRPYLLIAFEEAEPGTEYVITRYRDSNANLRSQFNGSSAGLG